jgi:hypothetical protein
VKNAKFQKRCGVRASGHGSRSKAWTIREVDELPICGASLEWLEKQLATVNKTKGSKNL